MESKLNIQTIEVPPRLYNLRSIKKNQNFQSQTAPDQHKIIKTILEEDEDIQQELKLWEHIRFLPSKPNAISNYKGYFHSTISNENKYHLIFDISPIPLVDIIKRNSNKGILLPFEKIYWYFKSMVCAMAFLQTLGICHPNLTPSELYIDINNEQIYLMDISLSKDSITKATELIKNELILADDLQYFSPELEIAFHKPDQIPRINYHKSDVFSLALIMLELCNSELPIREKDDFIWKANIDKGLKAFKQKYSLNDLGQNNLDKFINILQECLEIKAEDRPDFLKLFIEIIKSDNEAFRSIIFFGDKLNFQPEKSNFLLPFIKNDEEIKGGISQGSIDIKKNVSIPYSCLNENYVVIEKKSLVKTSNELRSLMTLEELFTSKGSKEMIKDQQKNAFDIPNSLITDQEKNSFSPSNSFLMDQQKNVSLPSNSLRIEQKNVFTPSNSLIINQQQNSFIPSNEDQQKIDFNSSNSLIIVQEKNPFITSNSFIIDQQKNDFTPSNIDNKINLKEKMTDEIFDPDIVLRDQKPFKISNKQKSK